LEKRLFFTTSLLHWHKYDNIRKMPWKGIKDPYKIWISEVILQQTRVEQGISYYKNFIKQFPSIKILANAPEEKVYKAWEGLGYYRRCTHLIESARTIEKKFQGKFPKNFEDILSLKGIGNYTAAAIASFAYDLPYAVVDGNVNRVFARFFGIKTPVDTTQGKKEFALLAGELLARDKPSVYNQAIMDFGAVICKPAAPLCEQCPLSSKCFAYLHASVNDFPVKMKKQEIRNRYFYFLDMVYGHKVYIQQRKSNDIWKDLYQFLLIETDHPTSLSKLKKLPPLKEISNMHDTYIQIMPSVYKQKLTHQSITARFIKVQLSAPVDENLMLKAIPVRQLKNFAYPGILRQYLKEMYL